MSSKFQKAPCRRGILTFEWVLIIALTVIGVVGGIAVIRDAIVVEASSYTSAMGELDFGYTIAVYDSMVEDQFGAPLYTVEGSEGPNNTERVTLDAPLTAAPNSKVTNFNP